MVSHVRLFRPRPLLPAWVSEESAQTVFIDLNGVVRRTEPISFRVMHQSLPNNQELQMVIVPAGSVTMGSPPSVGYRDEGPPHYVRVNQFLISRYTITQQQWKAVMRRLPPCRGKGLEFPVDRVSWNDAQSFCRRLSSISGRLYRLPSEAEWEYACRAHTASAFCYGDMITTEVCNYVGLHAYGAGPKGTYRHGPIPSGGFPPNAFGLHDMHGNLWEWCEDTWHDDYSNAPASGEPWTHGGTDERVLRGGSWHDPPDLCRSSCRLKLRPTEGEDFVGVRIALTDGRQ